jgi:hypothetical protein
MLVNRILMDPEAAALQVWAAEIRDQAAQLCMVMDAWHAAWVRQQRPGSAQNLTGSLDSAIKQVIERVVRLSACPPNHGQITKVATEATVLTQAEKSESVRHTARCSAHT